VICVLFGDIISLHLTLWDTIYYSTTTNVARTLNIVLLLNIKPMEFNSFDFSFCITTNVLTYLVIRLIDDLNGDKVVTTWQKRLVLITVVFILAGIYVYIGEDTKRILNSAILAPVYWSWIGKPIVKLLKVDYKKKIDKSNSNE
jgi:hypothetical protein